MSKKKSGRKKPGRRVPGQKTSASGVDAATKPHAGESPKRRGVAAAGRGESPSTWSSLLAGSLIFLISSTAVFGPYGQGVGYMPDLHMAAYIQVGAMAVLSLFLVSTFVRKRMQIIVPRSPLLLPALLFYAWAMLSVLWADTKFEAVSDALDWSGAFLCGLLVVLLLRELKLVRFLLFFLVLSGLLMALLAIGQFLFGIDWVHQHIVPAATFSNKNMAGQYGVLIFPLALMFFLTSKTRVSIWFFAVTSSLLMVYIFYTRSRGAMVSLLVEMAVLAGLLAYFKFSRGCRFFGDEPVKKVALAVSLLLFVGISFLTPAMFGNVDKVMEASLGEKPVTLSAKHGGELLDKFLGYEKSASDRFAIWENSMPMFKDHFLIGVGLGNWTIHYAAYQARLKPDLHLMENKYHTNAHNDYVEILCELGIIGFALLIWLIVSFSRVAGRLLSSRDEEHFLSALPIVTVVVGIAVNAFFSFPLKQPVPIMIVVVYLALLSNLHGTLLKAGEDYVASLPAIPVRAAAAVVVLATAGLFELQRNWYHAESHYHNALISMERGDYRNVLTEIRRAYRFNPMRTQLLWMEATALLQLGDKDTWRESIEMLEKVNEEYFYSANTLLNLAAVYNTVGEQEAALEAIEELHLVQPIHMPLQYRRAVFLRGVGRLEESLKKMEVYHRGWLDYHQRTSEMVTRLKGSEGVEAGDLKHWEDKLKYQRIRLPQIVRDINQVKREIQQRNASLTNGSDG